MKRTIKLILATILTIFLLPTCQTRAASPEPSDFGEPIQTIVYEDASGAQITEKIYFISNSNSGISLCDTSGNGWYKNEKEYVWNKNTNNEKTMTYYAQGYFVWGNGDVSVSSCSGGINGVPSNITISNRSTTNGTGKYAAIFNKYAYVTFSFTATNPISFEQNFSVTIRVSESGNNI